MAFTTGNSLYGKYNGSTVGFMNNVANLGNPNGFQNLDLFQIVGEGGTVLLNVTNSGTVYAPGVAPTNGTMIAVIEGTSALGTTAALVCQGTFPSNYNNQQYDIFQISNDIELNGVENVAGGGGVIGRLTYNGTFSTT